jgi:hypothetical protein
MGSNNSLKILLFARIKKSCFSRRKINIFGINLLEKTEKHQENEVNDEEFN